MKVTNTILTILALKQKPQLTQEERDIQYARSKERLLIIKDTVLREEFARSLELAKGFANLSCAHYTVDLLHEDSKDLKEWLEGFESILSVSLTFVFDDGSTHCLIDGSAPVHHDDPHLTLPDWGTAIPMTDEIREMERKNAISWARIVAERLNKGAAE